MKKINLLKILESKYCLLVFVISLIVSMLLIPQKVFYKWYFILTIAFVLTFALTITCIVRNIKEKIKIRKHTSKSIISLILSIIGFSALQVCTIGVPVCGAAGLGLFAIIIPRFAFHFFNNYSVWIVVITIILQVISMNSMSCFKSR